jgi:hypothetical protein
MNSFGEITISNIQYLNIPNYNDFLRTRKAFIVKRKKTDGSTIDIIIPPLNTDISFSSIPEYIQENFDPTQPLPENFDLRSNYNNLTTPFSQLLCGSCWAVSTSNMISDLFVVSGGIDYNPNLSSTYLLSCDVQYGCGGGDPGVALQYIAQNGITTSSCVDYNFCLSDPRCTGESSQHFDQDPTILNSTIPMCGCYFTDKTHYSYYVKDLVRSYGNNADNIKKHIIQYGPVLGGFHIFKNFVTNGGDFSLSKDIYIDSLDYNTGSFNFQLDESTFIGSHAVVIIGWGTDTIGNTVDGTAYTIDYWLCRNSWGESWGKNGYFKIATGLPAPDKVRSSHIYNTKSQMDYQVVINNLLTGGILSCKPVLFEPNKPDFVKPIRKNNYDTTLLRQNTDYYINDIIPNQLRTTDIPIIPNEPPLIPDSQDVPITEIPSDKPIDDNSNIFYKSLKIKNRNIIVGFLFIIFILSIIIIPFFIK